MTQERDNMPDEMNIQKGLGGQYCSYPQGTSYTLTSIHTEVVSQRDELLAALKDVMDHVDRYFQFGDVGGTELFLKEKAQAAIKRAEGGKE